MAFSSRNAILTAAVAVGLAAFAVGVPNRGALLAGAEAQQPKRAATSVTAAGVTLHSVSIDLPGSDRMFPGNDADAINNNCLACHSAGMVLTQPSLTPTTWHRLVEKMRTQYKAPVDEADVPAIVAYLAAHKGVDEAASH